MAEIIVVDDELTIRAFVSTVLTATGHSLFEAANGREGLRILETRPVGLLITDLIMPEMDGIELIVTARKKWPQLAVMAMSGGSLHSAAYLNAAKHLGAIKTLPKPFGRLALLEAVSNCLDEPVAGNLPGPPALPTRQNPQQGGAPPGPPRARRSAPDPPAVSPETRTQGRPNCGNFIGSQFRKTDGTRNSQAPLPRRAYLPCATDAIALLAGGRDAMLLVTLDPGAYTVIIETADRPSASA